MLRGIRLAAWPTSWRRRPARDQARSRRRICGAAILRSVPVVQQLMEYAQNERHGASISELLGTGIDQVLEADPDRRVFIFGYSLGNLVALDFLFPRASLHMPNDARQPAAPRISSVSMFLATFVIVRNGSIILHGGTSSSRQTFSRPILSRAMTWPYPLPATLLAPTVATFGRTFQSVIQMRSSRC